MDEFAHRYQTLFLRRKKDYQTWLPVYCPALREWVFFNMQGFNHLRFNTDNTPRNPKEAIYKLGLLPLVRPVIHRAAKVEKYQKRLSPIGGSRRSVLKEIEYWSLVETVGQGNVRVRVILRRVAGSDKFHFWSVMKD